MASLALVGGSPVLFLSFYFVGFAADAVDGWVARKLEQTSRLGAVLDMVTDRCSTVGLLAVLCRLAPDRSFLWICLMLLDISSHWFQVYASAVRGENSHKVCALRYSLFLLINGQVCGTIYMHTWIPTCFTLISAVGTCGIISECGMLLRVHRRVFAGLQ